MRGAKIDLRLSLAGSATATHVYEIAGQRLASDLEIGQLAPFASAGGGRASRGAPAKSAVSTPGRSVYRGPGWVGGRLVGVESWRRPEGYLLRIEESGDFTISDDGGEIVSLREIGAPVAEEQVAAVLGPCLALALALRGIWCLHASAAGPEGSAVAMTGESGSGKSTLAAALTEAAPWWRRIGDDLLPIRAGDTSVQALPRFPQPNLPADLQWRRPDPEGVELAAVYLLEPGDDEVHLRRLSRRGAALALVGQTVAARLFDAELQARHLDSCIDLVRRLPVYGLGFPRRLSALPAMTAAIAGGSTTGC